MSVIIKDMEMPKTCSQCEIWSKCWDERPFWFERLEYCPLTELADRKDEPQTNADQHVQHVGCVESVEPTWTKEEHEAFYTFLWNVINPNEMQDYIGMFESKTEPQTERSE